MRTCVSVTILAIAFLATPVLGGTPTNGTVTPASGIYTPDTWYTFTTTHNDAVPIYLCRLLINTAVVGTNCVYVSYNEQSNVLNMRNDANADISPTGITPGTAGILENSQGRLDTGATTVSRSGSTVTVNWRISFKARFQDSYNTYLRTDEDGGGTIVANWEDKGDARVLLDDPTNLLRLQGGTPGNGNYTFALGTGSTITDWTNSGPPSYSIGNNYPDGSPGAEADGKWVGDSEGYGSGGTRTPELRRTVTVVPQTPYQIAVWVNTSGSPHTCSAFLQWKDGTVTGNTQCTTVASFTSNTTTWRRLSASVAPSGTTMTICLKLSWDAGGSGGGGNFDVASVTVDPACTGTSIATVSPPSITTPPPPTGLTRLTVTGTGLASILDAVSLSGPPTIPGTVVAGTKSDGGFQADFDLSTAPVGSYNLTVQPSAGTGTCPPITKANAFSILCSQPTTTISGCVTGTNRGAKGNTAHKLVLQGTGLSSLLPANGGNVVLKRTYREKALINGGPDQTHTYEFPPQSVAMAANGTDIEVTFDLSAANVLAGYYDIAYTHICPSLKPPTWSRGFLVYLTGLANGGFEDGWESGWNSGVTETSGPICQTPFDPWGNGLRPSPKDWDRKQDANGGFWRDGNYPVAGCANGFSEGMTGSHYAGFQAHMYKAFTFRMFQTIQAPNLGADNTSHKDFNVWADFNIMSQYNRFSMPVQAKIRLADGAPDDENQDPSKGPVTTVFESPAIPQASSTGDSFLTNPDWKATVPSGTVYTSNPPLLTIEIQFSCPQDPGSGYDNDQGADNWAMYVDNVRTDGPDCGLRVVWADRNGDGFVDMEDFALLQACLTSGGGTPGGNDCRCFDRVAPVNQIDEQDVAEFVKCATGPQVPWTSAAAPYCVP